MKKFLVVVFISMCAAVCAESAFAKGQGNALAQKGYVGNVGASVSPSFGIGADLFTSHGYSFGNGLWMGGGTGLAFPSAYDVFLPLFTEVKYTFMADKMASPFVSAKLGFMTNLDETLTILNPAFGVDLGRFSIFANVGLGLVSMRTYSLGFYWNFR